MWPNLPVRNHLTWSHFSQQQQQQQKKGKYLQLKTKCFRLQLWKCVLTELQTDVEICLFFFSLWTENALCSNRENSKFASLHYSRRRSLLLDEEAVQRDAALSKHNEPVCCCCCSVRGNLLQSWNPSVSSIRSALIHFWFVSLLTGFQSRKSAECPFKDDEDEVMCFQQQRVDVYFCN